MSWYAFDELEKAAVNTKELLLPFDLGTWARLGLLVIFTGSGMNSPNIPSGGYGDSGQNGEFGAGDASTELQQNPEVVEVMKNMSAAPLTGAFSSGDTAASAALIGAGITIGILIMLFFLVSSVFEFVYYQSLIDEKVRIRSNFRKHLRDGIRYLAFRVMALILIVSMIGAGALGLISNPLLGIFGLLAAITFLIPFFLILGLVNNFVIPETIKTEQTFWTSLKRGLGKAKNEWKQTLMYIVTRLGVKISFGVLILLYALAALLIVGLPLGILTFLAYMASPLLAVIPGLIGVLLFLIAVIGGQVITSTYLKFYALRVFENL